MKKLTYAIMLCLLMTACEKNDPDLPVQDPVTKRLLTDSETILKTNLDEAAMILADIIQDEAVMNELTILNEENRTFSNLSFSDLMDESKGPGASFRNLREKFLEGCASSESKGGWSDLAKYLAGNDCYIYCPYPSNFYPKGTNSFTIAGHPIDNDIENKGYRFEGKKIIEVTVDEEYADKYPVMLIMPRDEDKDDLKGLSIQDASAAKGDPVYEVKVGKVRCADYCGGIFEGTLELRVARGNPKIIPSTEELGGDFNTVITIDYPRDYAKAAVKGWTSYCYGGWFSGYYVWDSNWRVAKTLQCALAYEYDHVNEVTITGTVGYKSDTMNVALTEAIKTTYRGDFLGLAEWDRDWFFATNTRPGIYDEVKDGLTVRKTGTKFKLTTPIRTIY